MVTWLPLFHDMGMVGFLTLPMYLGVELVKVTPIDFLCDPLLWVELIDRHNGTMTAAPNPPRLSPTARVSRPGRPSSTCRRCGSRSRVRSREVADVEDLIDACRPFGLSPGAILPAYGMAEATLGVSFPEWDAAGGRRVDADLLEEPRLAVPRPRANPPDGRAGPLLEGQGGRTSTSRATSGRPRGRRDLAAGRTADNVLSDHGRPARPRMRTAGTTPAIWAT